MVNALTANDPQAGHSLLPRALSQDQKLLVSDTLSNFDASNLSKEDAKSIVEAFKEAGIKPGKELANIVSDLGFDARTIGDLAGVERPPHGPEEGKRPPPPAAAEGNLNTEGLQALQDILEDYDLNDVSDEEEEEILTAFEEAGLVGEEGSLFSLTV